jgi:hypothetical protein
MRALSIRTGTYACTEHANQLFMCTMSNPFKHAKQTRKEVMRALSIRIMNKC